MKLAFKSFVLLSSFSLGLTCLAASPPVRAEVSLYVVAPGDTLWGIANKNLKSPHDWKKLMEFNNLKDQSQLQVDQTLQIPVEWMKDFAGREANTAIQPTELPSEPVVPVQDKPSLVLTGKGSKAGNTVTAIYGLAELENNKGSKKLTPDASISNNNRIHTGDNSSVNITLTDGSMLVLLANTEIVLSQPIQLVNGELEYSVHGLKEQALISTGAGTVSAQTARFRVASENDGKRMRVEVDQGGVLVADGRKQRRISTGLGIQLSAGKEMPEPHQGPMRPNTDNLSKSSMNGETHLQWQEINDAVAYRAQLIYAADAYLVLFDEHLANARLDWHNISPGRYSIRLRSIDDRGLEGLNADLPFIVHGPLNPPRSRSPLDGAVLPVDTPWIAWSDMPEANAYVLQVARDPKFTTGLRELNYQVNNYYKFSEALPAGEYYWRVQSVSSKGVKSPFGDVRMFTIKP